MKTDKPIIPEISDSDKLILQQISELIKQAPGYWADVLKGKMKVTRAAVYYYSRGERGLKKGLHKVVLKLLIELIENEERVKDRLTEKSKELIDKMNTNQ